MGEGITIRCEQCDSQDSFIFVEGMKYFSLSKVTSQLIP